MGFSDRDRQMPDEACTACGRIFAVTARDYPVKERGSFHCPCGHLIREWKSTTDYDYTEKQAP